ncbi:MAG: cytochrome c3 family protein [Bacillota bacterium]
MTKAKFGIVIAVAVVCSLAFAAPALAWTHGNFSATTDACAGCHVAHAAQAPKLLKTGPTQTQFCFMCHGDGSVSAPYDVKDGFTSINRGTDKVASTAGGFVRQWVSGAVYNDVTSRHNVWGLVGETGYTINEATKQLAIPGGVNAFTGDGFVCGSCHDPHDGGTTPTSGYITGSATSPNPRLLRRAITVQDGTYNDLYVSFKFSSVGTFTYGDPPVDSEVYKVDEYVSGSTRWCGSCHNKFMAPTNSGHQKYYDMYRHAFGVQLDPSYGYVRSGTYRLPADTTFAGTPLELGADKTEGTADDVLACLTCHRAHSTTAQAAGWASNWPRSEGGTSSTSALLRMDNRGVCFNCHVVTENGTVQYNLPTP